MTDIFDKKRDIVIPNNNTDMYIYGMAASNEYVNRIIESKTESITNTSKSTSTNIKDNAISIISTIITELGRKSIEIAVALLKNISDYEQALGKNGGREKLYIDAILKGVSAIDKEVDSKITKSITDILMAVS
jgi:hypothetical protein